MGISRIEDVRAHAARRVTHVARFRRVAARAARGLRLRLDGVAYHEVAAVKLRSLDALGSSRFDGHSLRKIVTRLAIRLRVTRLAELHLLLLSDDASMLAEKRGARISVAPALRQRASAARTSVA